MNIVVKNSFIKIKTSAKNYQDAVELALWRYKQKSEKIKAEATKYKNEREYLAESLPPLKEAARREISNAKNVFTGEVAAEATILRGELFDHVLGPLNSTFTAKLELYRKLGLCPSKIEIEALVRSSEGNPLALRALSAVLENVGSPYRIDAPEVEEFENDLATLNEIAAGAENFFSLTYHHEAVEVFGGTARSYNEQDGSTFDDGRRWDNYSLAAATGFFESRMKKVDSMVDRWTGSVAPSIRNITEYEEKTGEDGKPITAEQQLAEDRRTVADTTNIVDNPAAHAAEIVHRQAEADKSSAETLKAYAGG